jgi:hypothetical protein
MADLLFSGSTDSYSAGNADMWLVKTDGFGIVLWNQTFGNQEDDVANSIVRTSDHGLLLAGYIDHSSSGSNFDLGLVKVDSSGKVLWRQTYSQFNDNLASFVIETRMAVMQL